MDLEKYFLLKWTGFNIYIKIINNKTKIIVDSFLSFLLKKYVSSEIKFFDNKKYILEISENNSMKLSQMYYKLYGHSLVFSTWVPPIPSKQFKRLLLSRIKSFFGIHSPEQLTISVTENCPNRCLHCALPNKHNSSNLELNTVKKIIIESLDLGFTSIIFDGGETLLYDQLEEAISFVDKEKAIVSLFSSGYGLSFEKVEILKRAGLYSINISIDSHLESKHDLMRGRNGSFKEAVLGIKNSINAGLLVSMYCVLTPFNINELEDLYNFACALNVHELSFYEIVPTGRWNNHDNDILSTNDRINYYNFVNKKENSKGIKIFSGLSIIKDFGCMAGKKWIHITPEGFVQPCACIPISYGNVYNSNLKKILKEINKCEYYCNKHKCLMQIPDFKQKIKKQD